MAKPISISMIADASDVAKGIKKGATDPLEELQSKFSDTARKGEESGKSIVDAYRDTKPATDKAAQAVEKLEDKLDEARKTSQKLGNTERDVKGLGDELDKASKSADKMGDAGKGIGDGIKRGTDRAEEGLSEFKDEANSTAKEAAASFDGSAESIGDIFQELAANAFAGFGPAGAIAGIAVAAGLGVAITAAQDTADAVNEAGEEVGQLAGSIIDAGGQLSRSDLLGIVQDWALEVGDSREMWEVWQESATLNLDKAQDAAKDTGLALGDMLQAMAGTDADASDAALKALRDRLADLDQQLDDSAGSWDHMLGIFGERQNIENARKETADYIKTIEESTDKTSAAQLAADAYSDSMEGEAAAAAVAEEALAAKNTLLEDLDGSLAELVGSWTDYQDAETGALDPGAYLEGIRTRAEANLNYADNIASIADQVSPETLNAIYEQGLDFAPMLQSIIDSGLVDQMDDTFTQGADASQKAIDSIDGTVEVDADTSKAEEKLSGFTSSRGDRRRGETADVTVAVDADTAPADATTSAYVENANGQTVSVNVAAVTDGANAQLDELAKDRSATLNISADPYSANADWAALVKDRQATLVIGADVSAAQRARADMAKPITTVMGVRPDPSAAYRVKADLSRPTNSTHHVSPDARAAYRTLNDLHGTVTRSLHIVEVEERTTRRYRP